MSRINVDFVAFSDVRFVRLAQLMSYADHDHARSKVEYLWLECTKRGTTELPQWVVESLLGEAAPTALVDAELARWTRGRGDSKTRLLHICGAEERCLWLGPKRDQSSKGGKARASTASRSAGRFVSSAGATPPAQTSAPAPAPAPAPAQKKKKERVPADWKPASPPTSREQQADLQEFIRHYRSKGTLFEEIQPAWENWQARTEKWRRQNAGPTPRPSLRVASPVSDEPDLTNALGLVKP